MDIETQPPVIIDHPPAGATLVREAIISLRKRGASRPFRTPAPVRQSGLVLEPGRIHAYAKSCGFTSPQGVPLTYPHLLAFPLHMALMLQPHFPFPIIGLVHLQNRISQHRRLDSGDRPDVTVRHAQWLAHEKGQAINVETEITRRGELVWSSASTYLRLGVKDAEGAVYDSPTATSDPLALLRRWNLPADTGQKYASISGDANPIHTSRIGSRLFGFRRPIAHGMWLKARALAALLPQQPIDSATAEVAFKAPAFLGGGLTLLAASPGKDTAFELRDVRAQTPHLRGVLTL